MMNHFKIIWIIFLLAVIYTASNSFNTFFREHMDPWVTFFYRLIESNMLLVLLSICLCVYYLYLEWKKALEDRYFSWIKCILWLVALYVLWKGNEWGWTYATIMDTFTFREFLMVCVVCLLCLELVKGLNNWINTRKTQEKKNLHFSTNIPNEYKKDEGWDKYIGSLVENLMNADTSQVAFAMGIAGEWGSGKTNFLHKLKDNLNIKECIVIEFNPWRSSTPQNIVNDYFDTLKEALLPHYSALDKPLSRYAKTLVELDVNDKVTKYAGWLAKEEQSLQSQQENISRCLEYIRKPIFILIDDLDRLDKDEVFEVLKLVRNTAQFKNMVYVVTYDKDYIVGMLEKKGVSAPHLYIQKIFPLEVSLPGFEEYLLPQLLYQELKHLDKSGKEIVEQLHDSIYRIDKKTNRYVITDYLKTFRDIQRFSMAFMVNLNPYLLMDDYKNEIYLEDFFWLEMLHYADLNLYMKLKNNPQEVLERGFINKTRIGFYKMQKDIPNLSTEQYMILDLLFKSDGTFKNRLRYLTNYSKYFTFRLGRNQIATADFKAILSGEEDLVEWIKKYAVKMNGVDYTMSLYFHLDTFNTLKKKLNINKRYLGLLLNYLQFIPDYQAAELIVRHLNSAKFDSAQWNDLGMETQRLFDELINVCNIQTLHQRIAVTLSKMYGLEMMVEGEQICRDKSLLENIIIEDLAEKNMKRFLANFPHIPIGDIIKTDSSLYKILASSRVADEYYEEVDECAYHSLVIDSVIEHYKSKKEANEYQKIIDHFGIDFNDENIGYIDDVIYSGQNNICKLFGTLGKYKEFLEECFVIPEGVLQNHLKNINYSSST